MFVIDTQEYIVDTSECRLSSEPCECILNNRERSGSVCILKPNDIRSRVRRIQEGFLGLTDTHDLYSAGYTLC